ncbi:MAG TPA: hypothetical protein OIM61_00555 [Clostridiaceae bacterium]|jgi:hypothetical protein|nr:hypothetical protein [Clostridia bacterium]CDC07157.1 unknown [Clostridium sp. CAG:343]HJJ17773.1 hypothetical protein [Clostridiaceae bacterium]
MNKNQKTKEKTCAFYASDYHFEMISLPYINKKLDESKEVIVLTENNLKETIKTLVSKINLNEDKKVDILKIDWENNDLNKFKKINEDIKSKKDMVIFVKGKENYIKNINENIEKWTEKSKNVEIIDCYDMEEISQDMDNIMDQYKFTLKTTGKNIIK